MNINNNIKYYFSIIFFVLTLLLAFTAFPSTNSPIDYANWWIKQYGTWDTNHELVIRVHKVFDRVLAVADKQGNYFPKLIILRSANGNYALCLKDGSVLISKKAIEICYNNKDMDKCDSKIAFIIAHELSHLAKNDFWKPLIKIQKHNSTQSKNKDSNNTFFQIENDLKDEQKKEIEADDFAIVYMAMAGYNPRVIIGNSETNFFHEWLKQSDSNSSPNDPHPAPDNRVENIKKRINNIVNHVEHFNIGVRLYQLGKLRDALAFFESFCEKFPSREVYNNIGLIHYKLAIQKMAKCDKQSAYRFKLSTALDINTIASQMIYKNNFKEKCKDDLFKLALRYLRKACEKDPFYLPAHINYSSALIMAGKYSKSVGVLLDESLQNNKANPGALNNLAVSFYLLGPNPFISVDMFKDATAILKDLIKKYPEYSSSYYNLGRIQDERGRYAASKDNWKKFLKFEKKGVYAQEISKFFDYKIADTKSKIKPFEESCPIRFGEIDISTEKQLKNYQKKVIKIGTIYCEVYSNNNIRAIALDDVVEIVEAPINKPVNIISFNEKYGKPLKTFENLSGSKTLLFKKFAVDIQNDKIIRVIHFESKRVDLSKG